MADPTIAMATDSTDDEDENLGGVYDDDDEEEEEAAAVEEAENADDENGEIFDVEAPWRLRQAADDVLDGRPPQASTSKAAWKRFSTDAIQVSIFNQPRTVRVIHQAFEFAASTVLNAIRESAAVDDVEEDDDEQGEDWRNQLPQFKENSTDRVNALQQVWESSQTTKPIRKFTRNTPASSAASLDTRFQSSRAMLCGAANLALSKLTPGPDLSVLQDVVVGAGDVNLGAVTLEAQTAGERAVALAHNAIRRSEQRYEYRKRCTKENAWMEASLKHVLLSSDDVDDETDPRDQSDDVDFVHEHNPDLDASTQMWQSVALPRFLKVLQTGVGHAVYHDIQWGTRHGRIADVLQQFGSYGPHLILTTQPDLEPFAKQFRMRSWWNREEDTELYVLPYVGSAKDKRELRRNFSHAKGLPSSSFHVLVASYKSFFEDYFHFTALPWDIVVVDDGVAWMAAGRDSELGRVFEDGLFSASDHFVGLAGTTNSEWDFTKSVKEQPQQDPFIGLTSKHRILTASAFHSFRPQPQRQTNDIISVLSLLEFTVPHFVASVREEWDRSKIGTDAPSMNHLRKLVSRSVIVHLEDDMVTDEHTLVLQALTGKLPTPDRSEEPTVPKPISDEEYVNARKIQYSRRWNLLWLGSITNRSWLRYELGISSFDPIFDYMKKSNDRLTCEEVTTASSTTSSGATGQVSGTMAFRLALRCGRHFGSEPGLRQHINAHHAPAGTWLCRACSVDCITSQARTHHERSCGQPLAVEPGTATSGATPTVGQGGAKKANKKKTKTTTPSDIEKDKDGSIKVPGYRGVWVNKAGKNFIKIGGERHVDEESHQLLLFATADEAAKKYDDLVNSKTGPDKGELNFKEDGSRIVYGDATPASTSNVVPALSKINIKDLPPDVKPLLRDPRQTSRTGGNSKRHVYAYRGVCRQKRKGHDRWQSQISFMGVNHYLGTFDSEWDAAAIYAWAHLILYGPEATRQAQKEGEEAAAAYEQEKKDLAEGKIPEPPPKPEKKKRQPGKKKNEGKDVSGGEGGTKKRKHNPAGDKKRVPKIPKADKDPLSLQGRGVQKLSILGPKDAFKATPDEDLMRVAVGRAKLSLNVRYSSAPATLPDIDDRVRPCVPGKVGVGRARFVGLSPSQFSWNLQDFCETQELEEIDATSALRLLSIEYAEDGVNEQFASIMQGTFCSIGRASTRTQQLYSSLGLGALALGGSVGMIDCHVGGVEGSCSERAACIWFDSGNSEWRIGIDLESTTVSLNGNIVEANQSMPLNNGDVCSVGARVFAFFLTS